MLQIDDLIEPGFEQIVLPAILPLPWPHRITLRFFSQAERITPRQRDQLARKPIHNARNRRIRFLETPKDHAYSVSCENFTGDYLD